MSITLRYTGPLSDVAAQLLAPRGSPVGTENDSAVSDAVRRILKDIANGGDEALQRVCRSLDGVDAREVPREVLVAARNSLEPSLLQALQRAASNLRRVSEAQLPETRTVEVEPGVTVQRLSEPLACVGVYAPGGTAAYASSVLMGVVPATVAGVSEIIVCSPPGEDEWPSPFVLAAAELAGATRVFSVGGAQAIAAMAYGSTLVPKVQRIVGPGNAWVAEAKRQVSACVAIDSPAGPSELLLIASADAEPTRIAAEMLAQAEHDEAAVVVTIVETETLREQVQVALSAAALRLPRAAMALRSLAQNGALLVSSQLQAAVGFANAFAAEHVLLAGVKAQVLAKQVRCSGTVYVGEGASVAFGDYLTGCNHVLPTAGAARMASGLSVFDFLRFSSVQTITAQGAVGLSLDTQRLAMKEGLAGHAEAARVASSVAGSKRMALTSKRVANAPMTRVDLSDNTNRFGTPPSLQKPRPTEDISRYPTPYADELREALASFLGTSPNCIVTGCGSDDVIASAICALSSPGDALALERPTFSMIEQFARLQSLRVVDLDSANDAAIVYLGAPNNPTGRDVSWDFVESILQRSSGVVLVDEAYVEYSGRESFARRAAASERVIVTRTFSKAYGMAGLRVGYGVACPALVTLIEQARGPYKVSRSSESQACAVLKRDADWVASTVAQTITMRERLAERLRDLGLAPLPSSANFLLVPVAEDATSLVARLARAGVGVRAFPSLPVIGEAVRITVGPQRDLDALLQAWSAR